MTLTVNSTPSATVDRKGKGREVDFLLPEAKRQKTTKGGRRAEEDELEEELKSLGWSGELGSTAIDQDELDGMEWEGFEATSRTLLATTNLLIMSPPLSSTLPFPALFIQTLPFPSPSSSKPSPTPRLQTKRSKLPSLTLPPSLTSSAPYSFAQPTLLSASPTSTHILIYFPRVSERYRMRLIHELARKAQNLAQQNGGQGLSKPGRGKEVVVPPSSSGGSLSGSQDDEEEQGGILALYVKSLRPPQPGSNLPGSSSETSEIRMDRDMGKDIEGTIWEYTYALGQNWEIKPGCGGVRGVQWLFEPRRWVATPDYKGKSKAGRQEEGSEENKKAEESTETGETAHPEVRVNGTGQTSSSSPSPTTTFKRLPPQGPLPAISSTLPTSSTSPNPPTFLVLFSNFTISLYFHSLNITPQSHSRLEVLSCTLLTPELRMQENVPGSTGVSLSDDGTILGHGHSHLHALADSSGAQQGDLSSVEENGLWFRRRKIRLGRATMGVRKEDETIWVAFQGESSARPHDYWRRGRGLGEHGQSQGQDGEKMDVDTPYINGNGNGNGNGIGANGNGVGTPVSNQPPLTRNKPPTGPDPVQGWNDFETDSAVEDWVQVAEVKIDLLSNVATMRSRPLPRIPFHQAEPTSGTPLASLPTLDLQSIAFTELPNPEDATTQKRGDDRDLGVLLVFDQQSGIPQQTRLDLIRFQARPMTLSDVFGSLGAGVGGGRKAMQEAEKRFEWVPKLDKSIVLHDEIISVLNSSDSTLLNKILVKASLKSSDTNYLAWLNTQSLELDMDTSVKKRVVGHEINISKNGALLLTKSGSKLGISLVPCPGWNPASTESIAIMLTRAMLQGSDTTDILRASPKPKSIDAVTWVDEILDGVWGLLDAHEGGEGLLDGSVWIMPIMRLQCALYKMNEDPRFDLALSVLKLVAVEEAFEMSAFLAKKPPSAPPQPGANGTSAIKAEADLVTKWQYDPYSIWFLLAHVDWYLELVRILLKECLYEKAFIRGKGAKDLRSPHALLLIHHSPRAMIQNINSHALSFAKYLLDYKGPIVSHPLRPSSMNTDPNAVAMEYKSPQALFLAKGMLKDRLQASGLRLLAFAKALEKIWEVPGVKRESEVEEMANGDAQEGTGISLQELTHALLHSRLLPTPTIKNALISFANNSTIVVGSQLSVIANTEDDGLHEIQPLERDIITTEVLAPNLDGVSDGAAYQRNCNICGGRSVAYPMKDIPGQSGYARWMKRFRDGCLCGGEWQPA